MLIIMPFTIEARLAALPLQARRCRPGQTARCFAAAVVLAVASTGDVLALWDDKLLVNASERLTYDDNVYRLSRDAPVAVPYRGDWYSTTSLGLALDVPVSRQRFQAAYNLNRERYRRIKDRDIDGYDGRAAWLWQLGNSWSGEAGAAQTKSLAGVGTVTSSGVIVGDIGSTTPNPVIVRDSFVNATYLLGANWRVRGGLTDQAVTNGDPARKFQDVDIRILDVSAAYVSRAGNSLGIAARQEEGRYPVLVPGTLVDNDFDQTGVGLVLDATLTGRSRIRARADVVNRRYRQFPVRDFSGNTGRVSYDWQAGGSLLLSATVFRELFANVDTNSSFVLADGAALRPAWKFSEKTDVLGNVDYSKRRYLGDPGVVPGVTPRVDHVWAVGVSIAHRPTRTVRLVLSLQHEERTSTVLFGDYQSNVVFGSAQIAF